MNLPHPDQVAQWFREAEKLHITLTPEMLFFMYRTAELSERLDGVPQQWQIEIDMKTGLLRAHMAEATQ
jgi:hypothetical protein